jgi:hypothetical protein
MADFLTRLIERSRGASPRVEPLIAPMFAAGPEVAARDEAADAANEEMNLAAAPKPQYQAPAPRVADVARRPDESPPATPPNPRESNNEATIEIKPAWATAEETRSAQFDQTSLITPLPPTPESVLPQTQVAPDEGAKPGLTVLADQSWRAKAGSLVVRPQVARAGQAERRDAITSEAAKVTSEASAPVIRVTIGRIDVRAVNAPAPPAQRATPPAPKLSLEEYLRSRGGRKR